MFSMMDRFLRAGQIYRMTLSSKTYLCQNLNLNSGGSSVCFLTINTLLFVETEWCWVLYNLYSYQSGLFNAGSHVYVCERIGVYNCVF